MRHFPARKDTSLSCARQEETADISQYAVKRGVVRRYCCPCTCMLHPGGKEGVGWLICICVGAATSSKGATSHEGRALCPCGAVRSHYASLSRPGHGFVSRRVALLLLRLGNFVGTRSCPTQQGSPPVNEDQIRGAEAWHEDPRAAAPRPSLSWESRALALLIGCALWTTKGMPSGNKWGCRCRLWMARVSAPDLGRLIGTAQAAVCGRSAGT